MATIMSEKSTPENKADKMMLTQSEVQQQDDTWFLKAIAKIGIGELRSEPVNSENEEKAD
jgi:hypothetical protein